MKVELQEFVPGRVAMDEGWHTEGVPGYPAIGSGPRYYVILSRPFEDRFHVGPHIVVQQTGYGNGSPSIVSCQGLTLCAEPESVA